MQMRYDDSSEQERGAGLDGHGGGMRSERARLAGDDPRVAALDPGLVATRRDAMRALLLAEVDRRAERLVSRRRAVRVAAGIVVLLGAWAWFFAGREDRARSEDVRPAVAQGGEDQAVDRDVDGGVDRHLAAAGERAAADLGGAELGAAAAFVDPVRDDPTVLASCRVQPGARSFDVVRDGSGPSVVRLDDLALGEWLREAGLAPARARVGDRVRVFALEPLAE
jgi:hypothetical protein